MRNLLPTPGANLRGYSLCQLKFNNQVYLEKKVARFREHHREDNPNPTNVFTGATLHGDLGAVKEFNTEHQFVSSLVTP